LSETEEFISGAPEPSCLAFARRFRRLIRGRDHRSQSARLDGRAGGEVPNVERVDRRCDRVAIRGEPSERGVVRGDAVFMPDVVVVGEDAPRLAFEVL
jgi:hypothetical protein